MIQYRCLSCQHGYTDLTSNAMPPPGRCACRQCGRKHVLLSHLARPAVLRATPPARPGVGANQR